MNLIFENLVLPQVTKFMKSGIDKEENCSPPVYVFLGIYLNYKEEVWIRI